METNLEIAVRLKEEFQHNCVNLVCRNMDLEEEVKKLETKLEKTTLWSEENYDLTIKLGKKNKKLKKDLRLMKNLALQLGATDKKLI